MALDLRPRTALAILVAVLVTSAGGSVVVSEVTDAEDEPRSAAEFVELEDGTLLWPYTSGGPSFDQRTLAINLIVYGDAVEIRRHLEEQTAGDWNETTDEREDLSPDQGEANVNGTAIAWGAADGATRYVYVDPRPETAGGVWLRESYQLHDGRYFGTRHHIRAYTDPTGGAWTAMQTHREHWDWFRLRHTVDSVEGAQQYVEGEFDERWFVEELWRENLRNERGLDSDGWATLIRLSGAEVPSLTPVVLGLVGVVGVLGRRADVATNAIEERLYRQPARALMRSPLLDPQVLRGVLLANTVIALYLFVRLGAIAAESLFPGLPPKLIVAAFYPFLLAGLPIVAYLRARQLERVPAFAAATLGFLIVILLDYTYLGVRVLPIDILVHRLGITVALGTIAAAASRTERRDPELGLLRLGVLLWLGALLVPALHVL